MQVSIFCAISLKKPINDPKIGVWRHLIPKMGSSNNGTHKKHILAWNH